MCHITRELSTEAIPSRFLHYGERLLAKKDGWLQNDNATLNLRVHCRHTKTGEADTHSLAPGEVLICEDEAVLTILGQEAPWQPREVAKNGDVGKPAL